MIKILFVASLIILSAINCQEENVNEPFNYESDTPEWLMNKIDSMSVNREYRGTKIFRYEWKNMFVYHISIPIRSCALCELYDHYGNIIQLINKATLEDFLNNKRNETLVWQWKD